MSPEKALQLTDQFLAMKGGGLWFFLRATAPDEIQARLLATVIARRCLPALRERPRERAKFVRLLRRARRNARRRLGEEDLREARQQADAAASRLTARRDRAAQRAFQCVATALASVTGIVRQPRDLIHPTIEAATMCAASAGPCGYGQQAAEYERYALQFVHRVLRRQVLRREREHEAFEVKLTLTVKLRAPGQADARRRAKAWAELAAAEFIQSDEVVRVDASAGRAQVARSKPPRSGAA